MQSEPLKQKYGKKQSWAEERALSPLPPYTFPLSQTSQHPCRQVSAHLHSPAMFPMKALSGVPQQYYRPWSF